MSSILIVDDDKTVRTDLAAYLRGRGHRAETVADITEILPTLVRQDFDLILIGGTMPQSARLALLREILRQHPSAVVALAAADPTVSDAVEAIRAGGFDYLAKPLVPRHVERLLRRASAAGTAASDGGGQRMPSDPLPLLQSANADMARAIATARQVATSDVPVLLTGESGTGKKLLAAAIHAWSRRRGGPFATVWCAALAPHPIESPLLRHLDGALTDARKGKYARPDSVNDGTLFLDEIGNGNLPVVFQVRLLRFLEEHPGGGGNAGSPEIDVRIIAATIHDLEADVRNGHLRHDLFFRLNVVTIALPPLRERGEDLQMLTEHFLATLAARYQRGALRLAPEAADLFARYQWPGNVRELLSVLERAVVVSRGDTITPEALPSTLSAPKLPDDRAARPQQVSLHEIEQHHIARILSESATYGEAATRLGIDPTTLWRKRKRYRLERPLQKHP